MKLLLVGHSYVRDLAQFIPETIATGGLEYTVEAVHRSGSSYKTFLEDSDLWAQVIDKSADIILVILAANAITGKHTNLEIYSYCRQFYRRLRAAFPTAKIIAAQAELRFNKPGNRLNIPTGREYHLRRVAFNNFLKTVPEKNHILMIGGPNRLDDRDLYRDQWHLNREGLLRYYNFIRRVLRCLSNCPRSNVNSRLD